MSVSYRALGFTTGRVIVPFCQIAIPTPTSVQEDWPVMRQISLYMIRARSRAGSGTNGPGHMANSAPHGLAVQCFELCAALYSASQGR